MQQPVTVYLADLAHTATVTDASLPIPLGIGYIAAYLKAYFAEAVEIKLFKHPERLIAATLEAPPTVLGMAHYGWNDKLNQAVGRHLRAALPHTLMVGGGPNIDQDSALALAHLKRHDYLDYYVIEGGEEPFAELVDWWLVPDRKVDDLPQNVIWAEGDTLHQTAMRPLTKIIESVPSPYLGGFLDEFIDAGMVPLFETNRGCPFSCTFCAWGAASRNLVRRFSLETALAEIAYVGARSTALSWIVCDANFGMLKRDAEIARAIRSVKDENGTPDSCQTWLAKNVTQRNLEIAEILGDMVCPGMAVQSLDDDVLSAIRRDNISLETYQTHHQHFRDLGNITNSDVIVPLPNETLQSHYSGLRYLFDMQVDIISNHNCRMLAGCELSSTESREKWGLRTRYRLIHGDAGSYKVGSDGIINCFEYEESLRATNTMSETDVFFLRKLHFLIDFCWNCDVYKPILKYLRSRHGISPVDVLLELCGGGQEPPTDDLVEFWKMFDEQSQAEWFDSEEDIVSYFAEPTNFARLLNGEFEKLNLLFSVIALRDFKPKFDAMFRHVIMREVGEHDKVGYDCANLTFAMFPSLRENHGESELVITPEAAKYFALSQNIDTDHQAKVLLCPTDKRNKIIAVLNQGETVTISKIFNTQGLALRDLSLTLSIS